MESKSPKFRDSQAWSLDVMLAVIIFIGTLFFFYAILNTTQGTKVEELQDDASKILKDITSKDSEIRIADGTEINSTRLEERLGNYSEIKSKLRIENDFCIYFEDENGNILYINKTTTGLGSDIINVSGIPCG